MDAFRADRLTFYGAEREWAPVLETFGRRAVVFREAFTVSSWTKPAVASIFTAAYPGAHGVNARFYGLPEGAATLAEVLRGGGYFTLGVSANPNVGREAMMSRGFDVMDYTGGGSILEAVGPPLSGARVLRVWPRARRRLGPAWRTTDDGLELNRRLRFFRRLAGDRPTFIFIHYMEPHTPNMPRAEYREELRPFLEKVAQERVKAAAGGSFFWEEVARDPSFVPAFTPEELALAKALYDAEIRRMDVVVADLLDNVVGAAPPDRGAVVVLTADHGEEFLEHGRWLHGAGLHHEVARIPLLVQAPDCAPAVVAGPVNLVDLPRTLAAFAGCAAPEAWEGRDLGPYIKEGREVPPRELLLEGLHILTPPEAGAPRSALELNALVDAEYYYLRDENAGAEYLYERAADPRQEHNLAGAASAPGAADRLARERAATARAKEAVAARAFAPGEIRLPRTLQRQLKTLGYVR
jgi:arylsulfatase A-like enzyme